METQSHLGDQNNRSSKKFQAGDAWRWQLGLVLAAQAKIEERSGGRFWVPSQSGRGGYQVVLGTKPRCGCEDFELRQRACKHIHACGFPGERRQGAALDHGPLGDPAGRVAAAAQLSGPKLVCVQRGPRRRRKTFRPPALGAVRRRTRAQATANRTPASAVA